jgi:hypothetical protein
MALEVVKMNNVFGRIYCAIKNVHKVSESPGILGYDIRISKPDYSEVINCEIGFCTRCNTLVIGRKEKHDRPI